MSTKTKAGPDKLKTIAADMRARIEGGGAAWVHHRLERGLELVLQRKLEDTGAIRWRLALARPGVQPSAEEIAICQRVFNVPTGTEWELDHKTRINSKAKTAARWWIAEMYWYEA